MQLKFISRPEYRLKNTASFIETLGEEFGEFYCVPEGGSNTLALKGVRELLDEIEVDFDVITTACGTGGTLAGLVSGLKSGQMAKAYAALKGGDFLNTEVAKLLTEAGITVQGEWDIETDYHFGGYAKTDKQLFSFILDFKKTYGVSLDAVYTGKMFYGLFDQISKGQFERGTTIVALHTGGLQGNAGFKELDI